MPPLLPAFARKVLTASMVAFLLMCVPSQLVAMEREASAARQAIVLAWFSSLWSDLAAWLAELDTDEGCAPDPHGGCASQPETSAEFDTDHGCAPDPHGGCGS